MARGSAQRIVKTLRHVSNPFCFLSARNERTTIKSKIQAAQNWPFRRGLQLVKRAVTADAD
jgi:hypothetical protein